MAPCLLKGALLGCPHPVFDFGECLFDRIEIGRVRWQVPEPCTGHPNRLPDSGRLMGAEIIHDDNVAWLQHGHKLLLDIGAEAGAVDRPVEDARRSELITTQGAEEG